MSIEAILNDLAACLCNEVEARGAGPLCFCGVVPGAEVVQEYVGDCGDAGGMGWVRLSLSYPSITPGVVDQRPGNCGSGSGFDIEVGLVHEHSMYYEEEPITAAQAAAVVAQQMQDKDIVRSAIQCCSSLLTEDYILGSYTPVGPLGGLVGGQWVIYLSDLS